MHQFRSVYGQVLEWAIAALMVILFVEVSTGVVYAPWLVSANLNGPCIGGNVATNKDQCKNDGWKTHVRADGSTFKNQGDCIQYLNTGK